MPSQVQPAADQELLLLVLLVVAHVSTPWLSPQQAAPVATTITLLLAYMLHRLPSAKASWWSGATPQAVMQVALFFSGVLQCATQDSGSAQLVQHFAVATSSWLVCMPTDSQLILSLQAMETAVCVLLAAGCFGGPNLGWSIVSMLFIGLVVPAGLLLQEHLQPLQQEIGEYSLAACSNTRNALTVRQLSLTSKDVSSGRGSASNSGQTSYKLNSCSAGQQQQQPHSQPLLPFDQPASTSTSSLTKAALDSVHHQQAGAAAVSLNATMSSRAEVDRQQQLCTTLALSGQIAVSQMEAAASSNSAGDHVASSVMQSAAVAKATSSHQLYVSSTPAISDEYGSHSPAESGPGMSIMLGLGRRVTSNQPGKHDSFNSMWSHSQLPSGNFHSGSFAPQTNIRGASGSGGPNAAWTDDESDLQRRMLDVDWTAVDLVGAAVNSNSRCASPLRRARALHAMERSALDTGTHASNGSSDAGSYQHHEAVLLALGDGDATTEVTVRLLQAAARCSAVSGASSFLVAQVAAAAVLRLAADQAERCRSSSAGPHAGSYDATLAGVPESASSGTDTTLVEPNVLGSQPMACQLRSISTQGLAGCSLERSQNTSAVNVDLEAAAHGIAVGAVAAAQRYASHSLDSRGAHVGRLQQCSVQTQTSQPSSTSSSPRHASQQPRSPSRLRLLKPQKLLQQLEVQALSYLPGCRPGTTSDSCQAVHSGHRQPAGGSQTVVPISATVNPCIALQLDGGHSGSSPLPQMVVAPRGRKALRRAVTLPSFPERSRRLLEIAGFVQGPDVSSQRLRLPPPDVDLAKYSLLQPAQQLRVRTAYSSSDEASTDEFGARRTGSGRRRARAMGSDFNTASNALSAVTTVLSSGTFGETGSPKMRVTAASCRFVSDLSRQPMAVAAPGCVADATGAAPAGSQANCSSHVLSDSSTAPVAHGITSDSGRTCSDSGNREMRLLVGADVQVAAAPQTGASSLAAAAVTTSAKRRQSVRRNNSTSLLQTLQQQQLRQRYSRLQQTRDEQSLPAMPVASMDGAAQVSEGRSARTSSSSANVTTSASVNAMSGSNGSSACLSELTESSDSAAAITSGDFDPQQGMAASQPHLAPVSQSSASCAGGAQRPQEVELGALSALAPDTSSQPSSQQSTAAGLCINPAGNVGGRSAKISSGSSSSSSAGINFIPAAAVWAPDSGEVRRANANTLPALGHRPTVVPGVHDIAPAAAPSIDSAAAGEGTGAEGSTIAAAAAEISMTAAESPSFTLRKLGRSVSDQGRDLLASRSSCHLAAKPLSTGGSLAAVAVLNMHNVVAAGLTVKPTSPVERHIRLCKSLSQRSLMARGHMPSRFSQSSVVLPATMSAAVPGEFKMEGVSLISCSVPEVENEGGASDTATGEEEPTSGPKLSPSASVVSIETPAGDLGQATSEQPPSTALDSGALPSTQSQVTQPPDVQSQQQQVCIISRSPTQQQQQQQQQQQVLLTGRPAGVKRPSGSTLEAIISDNEGPTSDSADDAADITTAAVARLAPPPAFVYTAATQHLHQMVLRSQSELSLRRDLRLASTNSADVGRGLDASRLSTGSAESPSESLLMPSCLPQQKELLDRWLEQGTEGSEEPLEDDDEQLHALPDMDEPSGADMRAAFGSFGQSDATARLAVHTAADTLPQQQKQQAPRNPRRMLSHRRRILEKAAMASHDAVSSANDPSAVTSTDEGATISRDQTTGGSSSPSPAGSVMDSAPRMSNYSFCFAAPTLSTATAALPSAALLATFLEPRMAVLAAAEVAALQAGNPGITVHAAVGDGSAVGLPLPLALADPVSPEHVTLPSRSLLQLLQPYSAAAVAALGQGGAMGGGLGLPSSTPGLLPLPGIQQGLMPSTRSPQFQLSSVPEYPGSNSSLENDLTAHLYSNSQHEQDVGGILGADRVHSGGHLQRNTYAPSAGMPGVGMQQVHLGAGATGGAVSGLNRHAQSRVHAPYVPPSPYHPPVQYFASGLSSGGEQSAPEGNSSHGSGGHNIDEHGSTVPVHTALTSQRSNMQRIVNARDTYSQLPVYAAGRTATLSVHGGSGRGGGGGVWAPCGRAGPGEGRRGGAASGLQAVEAEVEDCIIDNRRRLDERCVLLDEVHIDKILGFGSMGMVYYGRLWDIKVVVKLIEHGTGLLGKEQNRGRLARIESIVSRLLLHPNIVTTYDCCTGPIKSGRLAKLVSSGPARGGAAGKGASKGARGRERCMTVMVQELCEGGTLKDALSRKKQGLDPSSPTYLQSVAQLALGIANGMKHLAALRIVHADLKAENVLLQKVPAGPDNLLGLLPKVADFGLAQLLRPGESEVRQGIHGTVSHMPPEAMRDTVLSLATDVYSFGVVLWELWTQEPPFKGMAAYEVVEAVCNNGERPVWPANAPPQLVALSADCWQADPYGRPTFHQVVERLRSVAHGGAGGSLQRVTSMSATNVTDDSDELEAALRAQKKAGGAAATGGRRRRAAAAHDSDQSDLESADQISQSPSRAGHWGRESVVEAGPPKDPLGRLLYYLCQPPDLTGLQVIESPITGVVQWCVPATGVDAAALAAAIGPPAGGNVRAPEVARRNV